MFKVNAGAPMRLLRALAPKMVDKASRLRNSLQFARTSAL
jgi:short-subunit dehydrogenase